MSLVPKPSLRNYVHIALLLVLAFFSMLMLEITWRYIPFSTTASFLQIKQTEVSNLPYYIPVFYTHVYASMLCLIAGFTQFNRKLQKSRKQVHRFIGYIYIITILFFSAPTGLIMGIHANGGWIAKLFFICLSLLWWWCTYKALRTAINKDFNSHRDFMIRSYALTLSAITLRIWKVIIVYLFHPAPMDVYMIISGLGWIPNLLVAEYIISQKKSL